MNYTIKRLLPPDAADFKKLLSVFLQVFADESYEMKDDYLETLLARQDYYAVAAFDKDMVIGGVTGYELQLPSQKREIYLYDLAVDEQYRKQGVATALIEELKVHAKKSSVSVIFVEAESGDEDAVGFYTSLGAEQVDVEHFNIDPDL